MKKFDDKKMGYTAIVYIMESSNSVIVHFDGFNNLLACLISCFLAFLGSGWREG